MSAAADSRESAPEQARPSADGVLVQALPGNPGLEDLPPGVPVRADVPAESPTPHPGWRPRPEAAPATARGSTARGSSDDPVRRARLPDSPDDLAEAAFRRIADSAPVMIWRADATGACDFVNRPWLDFSGRGLEQEIGAGWAERVFPEDRDACLGRFAAALADLRGFSMDYRLRRHDGAWRWIRHTGTPFFGPDGDLAGFHGACIDVTDLLETEERMRRADAEREALLAELRHRVKNNAQATISFLTLQARRAAQPAIAAAMRAAATRVLLASQVQDRKFRSEALHRVELGEEIDVTARAAMDAAGRPGIGLEVQPLPERLVVPHGQAIPLALVANEILVNAARHAFPDGRQGRVLVALARLPDGQVELRIADDGIGLPEAVRRQPPRDCLGLHLATRLARQAQATLRFEGPPGTVAVVTFRPA